MTGAAMSLDGKRVIVIGGASGIGFAVAALAREIGAEVVIASRGAARVAAAVERLPGATGGAVDLRNEASVSGFFETLGAFDHLAITAGDWGGTRFVATKDLDLAAAGREVALVSSGDAGIYGLAALVFELLDREPRGLEIRPQQQKYRRHGQQQTGSQRRYGLPQRRDLALHYDFGASRSRAGRCQRRIQLTSRLA